MAFNLANWEDRERVREALRHLDTAKKYLGARDDLVAPVLENLQILDKELTASLGDSHDLWVPLVSEVYYTPDLVMPHMLAKQERQNGVWANNPAALNGVAYQSEEACKATSIYLQVLAKLANISNQMRSTFDSKERWTIMVENGKPSIVSGRNSLLPWFNTGEAAKRAWETLTDQEQQTYIKGF